jgi:hypothetical protein
MGPTRAVVTPGRRCRAIHANMRNDSGVWAFNAAHSALVARSRALTLM